jgi:phytoene dehydrogenase-like protein
MVAPRMRDAIIVGAGHNGLTCAAYLARAGLDVLVLERRDMVGGCAVSESSSVTLPGGEEGAFKFSRASYLAGLLRPHIVKDLKLMESYGLKLISRDPYSFTPSKPTQQGGQSLMLWSSLEKTKDSIGRHSPKDAEAFADYEVFLDAAKSAIVPLLDGAPPDVFDSRQSMKERWEASKRVLKSMSTFMPRRRPGSPAQHSPHYVPTALEVSRLFTSPATVLLDEWFESDILKTTLCTDGEYDSIC